MKRIKIIGVDISITNMNDALMDVKNNFKKIKGNYICAANVHTTVMAHDNEVYKEIQNNSYMTLPDGKPLSIYGKRKGYKNMGRVTGPDFFEKILEMSLETGWTHYFYGNNNEDLNILIEYIQKKYCGIKIAGFEPSLFRELSLVEKQNLCDKINKSNADFVWVALGAPKQEILCAELSKKTNAIWIGVGGAFNVVSGIIPRAPIWMQKMCLEWLYRLLKEPKRLFKRYFNTNLRFLYLLLKNKK